MIDPLTCMAVAIYFEARGEPPAGQMLVADTIINRVDSPRYPNNVCDVVKQWMQFSFYWDDIPLHIKEPSAYTLSVRIAEHALEDHTPQISTICHFARYDLQPYWSVDMNAFLVGRHVFYQGGC